MCQLLFSYGADVDGQDNRKVSVLMAAFRKGHIKVVKWLVKHVHQFPSDSECTRFVSTLSDKVRSSLLPVGVSKLFEIGASNWKRRQL